MKYQEIAQQFPCLTTVLTRKNAFCIFPEDTFIMVHTSNNNMTKICILVLYFKKEPIKYA